MNQAYPASLGRRSLCGLMLAGSVVPALAALGQAPTLSNATSPAQTASPGAKKMASSQATSSGLYALHESQLDSGTSVREFTTPDGVVFAVAWRGPVLPDLSNLLGGYFGAFKRQTDQSHALGKRGPVNVQRDDLVMKSNGRMRNFFGHAYAPSLVPAGVDIHALLQ